MHFDYKTFKKKGLRIVSLYYLDEDTRDKKEIWVIPGYGMNLCMYKSDSLKIIDFNADELRKGYYGTPLLYPTPNRVYQGKFTYNGRTYPQIKNGKLVTSHGLLHHEPFQGVKIDKEEDRISVSAYLDFNKENHLFQAFPFDHRLNIKYTLDKTGVRFDYEITSREEEQRIPYGIAIHPCFSKIDGEYKTVIKVPYRSTYETTEDQIPTGKLLAVRGETDISDYAAVGNLNLNHVFTGNTGSEPACIKYLKSGIKIRLECSEDFSNMVVYTPKGRSFFCMENQTCATNAHNLHEQGMEEVSGLKFVEPGSSINGFVRIATEKL